MGRARSLSRVTDEVSGLRDLPVPGCRHYVGLDLAQRSALLRRVLGDRSLDLAGGVEPGLPLRVPDGAMDSSCPICHAQGRDLLCYPGPKRPPELCAGTEAKAGLGQKPPLVPPSGDVLGLYDGVPRIGVSRAYTSHLLQEPLVTG